MTIRVDLTPETEARLIAEAQARGVSLEKLAERLLQDALTNGSVANGLMTVDDFHRMLAAIAEGSEALHDLSTENFTRESFYEGRVDGRDAVPGR